MPDWYRGGTRGLRLAKGFYVEPTIFDDIRNDMVIAQEEIFGPVVGVIPYDDEEDAVRIADASGYGLDGSVHSKDFERATQFARKIRTGKHHGEWFQSPSINPHSAGSSSRVTDE